MPAGIFISYRRDESRHAAARLADDLGRRFGEGRIFRDIEGIELGVEFAKALDTALKSCSVMLVLMGPQWLNMPDTKRGGRRLDQSDDWIRQEVATALKRNVRVVPVLLEGTALPEANELPEDLRPLVLRQAMELSDVRWRGDVQRLEDAIAKLPGFDKPVKPEPINPSRKKMWWSVGAAVLLVGGVASYLEEQRQGGGDNPGPAPVQRQGFPTEHGMAVCACLGPNPVLFANEPRCASGQVKRNTCNQLCGPGVPAFAYVCS